MEPLLRFTLSMQVLLWPLLKFQLDTASFSEVALAILWSKILIEAHIRFSLHMLPLSLARKLKFLHLELSFLFWLPAAMCTKHTITLGAKTLKAAKDQTSL